MDSLQPSDCPPDSSLQQPAFPTVIPSSSVGKVSKGAVAALPIAAVSGDVDVFVTAAAPANIRKAREKRPTRSKYNLNFVCILCQRKFKTEDGKRRHIEGSDMHKENLRKAKEIEKLKFDTKEMILSSTLMSVAQPEPVRSSFSGLTQSNAGSASAIASVSSVFGKGRVTPQPRIVVGETASNTEGVDQSDPLRSDARDISDMRRVDICVSATNRVANSLVSTTTHVPLNVTPPDAADMLDTTSLRRVVTKGLPIVGPPGTTPLSYPGADILRRIHGERPVAEIEEERRRFEVSVSGATNWQQIIAESAHEKIPGAHVAKEARKEDKSQLKAEWRRRCGSTSRYQLACLTTETRKPEERLPPEAEKVYLIKEEKKTEEEMARHKAEEENRLADEARKVVGKTYTKAKKQARLADEAKKVVGEKISLKDRLEEDERKSEREKARQKTEKEIHFDKEAGKITEEEYRLKAVEKAGIAAEVRLMVKEENKTSTKAATEARLAVVARLNEVEEQERLKAEKEARFAAEERLKEEEQARLKKERETQLAEKSRLRAVAEAEKLAHLKAEEKARLAEEARSKAVEEEQVRLKVKEMFRVAEEVRLKAHEEEQERLKAEDEAGLIE